MAKSRAAISVFPEMGEKHERGRVEIEVEEILTAEDSKAMNVRNPAFLKKLLEDF